MITVYNILRGNMRIDAGKLFTPSLATTTRGHAWKLQKPHCNRNIKKHCLSVRAINDWNSLPEEVVEAEDTNKFKARLDRHWHSHHYNIRQH